jgi:hypothetical protein
VHPNAVVPGDGEGVSAKVIGRGDAATEVASYPMRELLPCDVLRMAIPGIDAYDMTSCEWFKETQILIWESHMDQHDLGCSFQNLNDNGLRLIRGVQRRMDRGMWIFMRTKARFDVQKNSYILTAFDK